MPNDHRCGESEKLRQMPMSQLDSVKLYLATICKVARDQETVGEGGGENEEMK